MYITISPNTIDKKHGTRTCSKLANYCEKENNMAVEKLESEKETSEHFAEYLEKENKYSTDRNEMFFNGESKNIEADEVVNSIDNNKKRLKKDEAFFYNLTVNPSKEEINHLKETAAKEVELIKKYAKDVEVVKQAEEKIIRDMLKQYTVSCMDQYARNFGREGVESNKDLVWFAKVEKNRYYKYDDPNVKHNQAINTQVKKLEKQGKVEEAAELKKDLVKESDLVEGGKDVPVFHMMPKAGDNYHVHVIVSRNNKEQTRSLSPQSKGKYNPNHIVNGKKCAAGFDRDAFYHKAEFSFDKNFEYDRDFKETYLSRNVNDKEPEQYKDIERQYNKNKIEEKITNINREIENCQLKGISNDHPFVQDLNKNLEELNRDMAKISVKASSRIQEIEERIKNGEERKPAEIKATDTLKGIEDRINRGEKRTDIKSDFEKLIEDNSSKNPDPNSQFYTFAEYYQQVKDKKLAKADLKETEKLMTKQIEVLTNIRQLKYEMAKEQDSGNLDDLDKQIEAERKENLKIVNKLRNLTGLDQARTEYSYNGIFYTEQKFKDKLKDTDLSQEEKNRMGRLCSTLAKNQKDLQRMRALGASKESLNKQYMMREVIIEEIKERTGISPMLPKYEEMLKGRETEFEAQANENSNFNRMQGYGLMAGKQVAGNAGMDEVRETTSPMMLAYRAIKTGYQAEQARKIGDKEKLKAIKEGKSIEKGVVLSFSQKAGLGYINDSVSPFMRVYRLGKVAHKLHKSHKAKQAVANKAVTNKAAVREAGKQYIKASIANKASVAAKGIGVASGVGTVATVALEVGKAFTGAGKTSTVSKDDGMSR